MTSTVGAALLVAAGVLAPLGLSDEIVPGDLEPVEFQYVKDPSPWGTVTMPRPDFSFTRLCESGTVINCPGQYQGVFMNETSPGRFQSHKTDESSTVNLTLPVNYTAMFTSATSDKGNTVSGLFDIQYRRWVLDRWGVYDHGRPFVRGAFREIESLITQEKIILKEGLIIDMKNNKPGIGFRNHTVPVGLAHGGIWSEDITWTEPVTQCADTNLSIELRTENPVDDISDNHTFFIVDRGAFHGLDKTALESPPWTDNQTLDLFGRAYKAARMHNVLVASSLNISLPLDPPATKTMPKILVRETTSAAAPIFNYQDFDSILTGDISGVGGGAPMVSQLFTGNTSRRYPNGVVKLRALNYTAIAQICRGYYAVRDPGIDLRANNITNPAVQCGFVLGAALQISKDNLTASNYSGVETYQKKLYICATGIRASIKTVDFQYNATGAADLSNLKVLEIKDKVYPDENSKPLWAVEHSYDKVMRFDPLWGIIDNRYETVDGFYSLRAEKLWLPTSPHLAGNFGETEGSDALAAVSGHVRRLGNLYNRALNFGRDYSGKFEYALFERYQRLSNNETEASQIPSLIMTDGLAAGLVGTKTSISTRYVEWPASLSVDGTTRGFPRARVSRYKRAVRYDIRYAIPGFILLALLIPALVAASGIALSSPSIFRTMRNMYNQTSAGRLATSMLPPGRSDPKQPSHEWVEGGGKLTLSFGQIREPDKDYFCMVVEDHSEENVISVTHNPKYDSK
jgi:hypothetical protein